MNGLNPPAAYSGQVNPPKGLSPTVGTIIVILAGLIAGLGVWVYYNYKVIPEVKDRLNNSANNQNNMARNNTGNQTSDWQTYSNAETPITFEYPTDWVVVEDFIYETAGGEKATNRTIVLCPRNVEFPGQSNVRCEKCISFNYRQETCADFGPGLQIFDLGTNRVCCTGGSNAERDQVIEKIKETFK